jgi:uncharacterized protein (TIGR04255 family)
MGQYLFWKLFEVIRPQGFSERQERKGIPAILPIGTGFMPIPSFPVPIDQMVFRNLERDWGIIMSKGNISFHVLSNYAGWDSFKNELIGPFYDYYLKLGLGSGRRNCTIMYLNRFEKIQGERLSKYFSIASPLDNTFGPEKNTILQRLFRQREDLFLITKLTTQETANEKYIVNLECGATSVNGEMYRIRQRSF